MWWGLGILLVFGLAQLYYLAPAGRQLPYSEFKRLLKDGAIAEVFIGDQVLRGTLKQAPQGDAKQSTSSPRPASTIPSSSRSSRRAE